MISWKLIVNSGLGDLWYKCYSWIELAQKSRGVRVWYSRVSGRAMIILYAARLVYQHHTGRAKMRWFVWLKIVMSVCQSCTSDQLKKCAQYVYSTVNNVTHKVWVCDIFLCANNMDQNSLPNIQPMNIMCSYRHRNGEMCRTRSFTPRCAAHTGRQTHALCISCSVNFTSSKYMICSDIDCLSVRDSYRAQMRARRSYYDAAFVRECSEMLAVNAADMTA